METNPKLENYLLRRANVADYAKRAALRDPGKICLVEGDREITTAEFDSLVNRAARAFLNAGIQKGDRVSFISRSNIEFIALLFGVIKVGGVVNPINVLLKSDEIEYIVNHAKSRLLFVEDNFTPNVDPLRGKLESVQGYYTISHANRDVDRAWQTLDSFYEGTDNIEEPLVEAGNFDPATLLYTSGTESFPKGVLGSHISLYLSTMHIVSDVGVGEAQDTTLLMAPLYHITGIVVLTTYIYLGAKVVILPSVEPQKLLELTEKHQVRLWTITPAALSMLPQLPGFSKDGIASVNLIIAFGSALPKAVAKTWKTILPEVKMVNYYGQTESGPLGTLSSGDDIIAHPGSIGKPHRLVEVKIVDENDQDVCRGEVGEIVMRGPTIMLEYYQNEKKTEQTLKNGWLHTGDLAKVDDEGFFHFVDRKKDTIVTGGENVSSLEVEQHLLFHPKIVEASVIGIPHAKWGESVTAVVVKKAGEIVNADDIINFCKERMAGYKVPKRVVFVDKIARNASGKAMKKLIREQVIDAE